MMRLKHGSTYVAKYCLIGVCPSNSPKASLTPEEKAAAEGQEYLFAENADKGIEAYTRAIELNGNQAEYYLNRGIAYKMKMQYDAAVADFNKAIELNPGMSASYFNRGEVYQLLGNTQQAKSDLDTAERLSASK